MLYNIFFHIFDDFIRIMSWKTWNRHQAHPLLWSELRRRIFILVQDGHTCHAECTKYVHRTKGFPHNKDGDIWRYKKKTFSHCSIVIEELQPCFDFLVSFGETRRMIPGQQNNVRVQLKTNAHTHAQLSCSGFYIHTFLLKIIKWCEKWYLIGN